MTEIEYVFPLRMNEEGTEMLLLDAADGVNAQIDINNVKEARFFDFEGQFAVWFIDGKEEKGILIKSPIFLDMHRNSDFSASHVALQPGTMRDEEIFVSECTRIINAVKKYKGQNA